MTNVNARRPTREMWLLFLLAAALRVALAALCRQANDNHIEVMNELAQNFHSLVAADCAECFQPKLYHLVGGVLFRLFSIESLPAQTLVANFLSAGAGIATLWVLLRYILATSSAVRALPVFALVALNPELLGIQTQATNDSFAILFGTLAYVRLERFIRDPSAERMLPVCVFMALGVMSKGSVWPLAASAVLTILVLRRGNARGMKLRLAGLLLVVCAAAVILSDHDLADTRRLFIKKPVVAAADAPELRPGTKRRARLGYLSPAETYLTFRFAGLLERPIDIKEGVTGGAYRTSLWTMLYGRMNSIHFSGWPEERRDLGETAANLSRAAYVLGLVLLALFVSGAGFDFLKAARWARSPERLPRSIETSVLAQITIAAYLAFLVVFLFQFRDFAAVKGIFILPGGVAFVHVVRDGSWPFRFRTRFGRFVQASTLALLVVYALQAEWLIARLARINLS